MPRFRPMLAVVLALLMAFSATAQEENLEPVTIFASFIPNVQFAPLYVAIEEGYFAEQGFDVEIVHGDENIGMMQVAQGDPRFGIISGEQVIMARSRGIPVKYVYAWFQGFPIAVVARDGVKMEGPADLAGLRVGLPGPFGASYSALTALLSLAGLTESDIDMQSIGYAAPDILCAGGVDAAIVYINNEPLEIARRIKAGQCGDLTGISVLDVAEFVPMTSNGIVVNETTLADSPEDVRGIVAAFDAGAYRSVVNPARAYLYSLNFVENLPQSAEFVAALEAAADEFDAFIETSPAPEAMTEKRAEIRATLGEQFTDADLAQFDILLATGERWGYPNLGYIDPVAWQNTLDLMVQMGQVPADFDLTGAYITDYVPESRHLEAAATD